MRFRTKKAAFEHVLGKRVPDPDSWDHRNRREKRSKQVQNIDEANELYGKWIQLKRMMFSPNEYKDLMNQNHPFHKQVVNWWVDYVEGLPRKRVHIIVVANRRTALEAVAKVLNPRGSNWFSIRLRTVGNQNTTHYACSAWNMSQSEYDHINQTGIPGVYLYDADQYIFEEAIYDRNLERVPEEGEVE